MTNEIRQLSFLIDVDQLEALKEIIHRSAWIEHGIPDDNQLINDWLEIILGLDWRDLAPIAMKRGWALKSNTNQFTGGVTY